MMTDRVQLKRFNGRLTKASPWLHKNSVGIGRTQENSSNRIFSADINNNWLSADPHSLNFYFHFISFNCIRLPPFVLAIVLSSRFDPHLIAARKNSVLHAVGKQTGWLAGWLARVIIIHIFSSYLLFIYLNLIETEMGWRESRFPNMYKYESVRLSHVILLIFYFHPAIRIKFASIWPLPLSTEDCTLNWHTIVWELFPKKKTKLTIRFVGFLSIGWTEGKFNCRLSNEA